MLGELENELLGEIRDSELGKRLKTVADFPDVPDKDALNRWGMDAPAAYVVSLDGQITDRGVTTPFAVVLVAKNARGHTSARQGDARVIGLYEMVDASLSLLHGSRSLGGVRYCSGYQFLQEVELRNKGLFAAVVTLQCTGDVPAPSAADLSEFDHLYADWAVVPNNEQNGKPLAEALISLNPELKESP